MGRGARSALNRGLARLGPDGLLDLLIRSGPRGVRARGEGGGLTLAKVRASEHGRVLGALEPRLPALVETADRKIDLAPSIFVGEIPALEADIAAASAPDSLVLIGRRHLRSNNSWLHNSRALIKGPERCTLLVSPADAARRSLATGDLVELRTRVGAIRVPVEVSGEMMEGVVSLPHGFGHDKAGTRLGVASERPGASLNDVTDDERLDRLSGNAAFSGTPVTVTRVGAPVAATAPTG